MLFEYISFPYHNNISMSLKLDEQPSTSPRDGIKQVLLARLDEWPPNQVTGYSTFFWILQNLPQEDHQTLFSFLHVEGPEHRFKDFPSIEEYRTAVENIFFHEDQSMQSQKEFLDG